MAPYHWSGLSVWRSNMCWVPCVPKVDWQTQARCPPVKGGRQLIVPEREKRVGGGMLEAILADCVFLPPPSHLYFCASLVSTVLLFVAVSFIVTPIFIFVLITCLYFFLKNSDVDQFVL